MYGVAERSSDLSCAWLVSAVPVHVAWMNKLMERERVWKTADLGWPELGWLGSDHRCLFQVLLGVFTLQGQRAKRKWKCVGWRCSSASKACLACAKPQIWSPLPYKLHNDACLKYQHGRGRGWILEVRSHPLLHSKFKANFNYMGSCLGKKKKKRRRKERKRMEIFMDSPSLSI